MKTWIGMVAAMAVLTASATAADAAPWVRIESDHFVVFSDTSRSEAADYLKRLETYHFMLNTLYGVTAEDDADTPKSTMYLLAARDELKQVWPNVPDEIGGWYQSCIEGRAAFAPSNESNAYLKGYQVDQRESEGQATIFHEYAHEFMFANSTSVYPHWYVEGFAEYYSTARFEGNTAVIGAPITERYATLMASGDKLSYRDVLENAPVVEKKGGQFYAQAWLLTHYMMATPQRQAQLKAYVSAVGQGKDSVEAFESTTGLKVDKLWIVLQEYLEQHLAAVQYRFTAIPAIKADISDMPAAAGKLMLWDGAVRTCRGRGDDALLNEIRTEAAKYPSDPYAQTVLARAEIVDGDEEKSVTPLSEHIKANPQDSEALGLRGEAYFLMAAHGKLAQGLTESSERQAAHDDLLKAYQIDPMTATTLYYLSLANNGLPGASENTAVDAAVEAHNLAPAETGYAFHAADLLIRKQRFDEAKTILYPMASNPHGGALAKWATHVIDVIESKASPADIEAAFRSRAGSQE